MRRAIFVSLMIVFCLSPAVHAVQHVYNRLPSLTEKIVIDEWHYIGPFISGPREPLANPLESFFHPLDSSGIPNLNATYPSTLEFGRDVKWQPIKADENGSLDFNFANVDWDKINDEWGASGNYFSGAAYAKFHSSQKVRALANAHRIGTFILNGVKYSGDPYGHRLIKTPVIIEEGDNHILFFFGGFGGSKSVTFSLGAVESNLMILENDILLPDFVRGQEFNGWAGIPVLNETESWIEHASLTLKGDEGRLFRGVVNLPPLAPLSVMKVPVEIQGKMIFPIDWETDKFPIEIILEAGGIQFSKVANARVRDPEQSRLVTFESYIDSSAQKFALRYPSDYDPEKEYSLILSLHGAGVRCEGQVDAYAQKDWAFVAAATNRRRFGFDWQDWGRLDAEEVLRYCLKNYPIDRNRVYLSGHSMGGHGVWHIGSTHASGYAAISPSAGWASFPLYIPWFMRRDELFADQQLRRILDTAHFPDRTELLLPNLRNTPVFAVHGADDDNVPPTHGRFLTGMLDRLGYQAGYWEVPGKGHWWDASPDVPGADCVDDFRIQTFFQTNVRDPFPKHVTFVAYDLGNNFHSYWVYVLEEFDPTARIEVDAVLERNKVVVKTHNVKRIFFSFSKKPGPPPEVIEIDGQTFPIQTDSLKRIPLTNRGADGWIVGNEKPEDLHKTWNLRGPIKRAFFSPFVIVVGTSGSDEERKLNTEIARNIAQRWWYRANGYVRVINDVLVDKREMRNNLILIGGPSSNLISARIAPELPLGIEDNGVRFGDKFIEGEDLALKFVYPNPESAYTLVLCNWGTSLEGTRLAGELTCIYSGSGLPDFLVYDREVRLKGYAGVKAAGYFDNSWELNPDYYYLD